jgi:hypothetical protein
MLVVSWARGTNTCISGSRGSVWPGNRHGNLCRRSISIFKDQETCLIDCETNPRNIVMSRPKRGRGKSKSRFPPLCVCRENATLPPFFLSCLVRGYGSNRKNRRGDRERDRVALVAVSGGVVLGTDDQTAALLGALIDGLADVDELLLVLEDKVELVVVTGAQIDHHVLVAEEPHDGAGVVQLVHLVEVGHLVNVAQVDDAEILDALGDLVQHLVLSHAVGIPVAPEADAHQALLLRQNGLIDVPTGGEMGENDGTHVACFGCWCCFKERLNVASSASGTSLIEKRLGGRFGMCDVCWM